MVNKDNPESFLSRWSSRKMETDVAEPELPSELPNDAPPVLDPNEHDADVASVVEQPNEQEPTPNETVLEDLPDVETLSKDSDYTGFLGGNVPEELANMALRKLWRSNPILANLDGLNDYDEDFSVGFGTEVIKTAYKVGKGFITDEDEEPPEGESEDKIAADVEDDEDHTETNADETNEEAISELEDRSQVEGSNNEVDKEADELAQIEVEKK